jgi:hypothetical protein
MSTYPKTPRLNRHFMTVDITDASTADQIFFVPGFRGKIRKIWTCLNDAITSADADITTKIGGTAVTNGLITIAQSGSASGDVDSSVPTALNTFTAGQAIEVETDGASSTAARVTITLELEAT